jgi:hypothetical protein
VIAAATGSPRTGTGPFSCEAPSISLSNAHEITSPSERISRWALAHGSHDWPSWKRPWASAQRLMAWQTGNLFRERCYPRVGFRERRSAVLSWGEPGYAPKGADYGPWAVQVMRTTRPPMDVMERCALAYLITGNERLGREAQRRLQHFFS